MGQESNKNATPENMKEHDDEEAKPVDLSRGLVSMKPETLVRMAWGGAVAIVAATLTVTAQLYAIHAQIEDVSRRVDGRTADRWTLSMEREEMNKLNRDNPMMKTPDVDEIWNRIRPWDSINGH